MKEKETRIIVCGGRDFNDYDFFKIHMDEILTRYKNVILVSGGAKGADSFAEQYALKNNIQIKVFPADWGKYGKSAGVIRNKAMLDYAKEEVPVVVAFWNGESRGTKNMLSQTKDSGVGYYIFPYGQNKIIRGIIKQ